MKRFMDISSRIGTILIAVSLALLVVSLIPPAQLNSFTGSDKVAPQMFRQLGPGNPFINVTNSNVTFNILFFSTLTPQQELNLPLKCNGTIDVYVLKVNLETFLANFQKNDVDAFTAFLVENPELVGWQGQIREGTVKYVPTEIINATVVFGNPSLDTIHIDYNGSILSLVASSDKVQTSAMYVFPLGVLFSLPLLNKFRNSPTKP
ncbi:MAG: hypothetical protein ACFCUE_11565 [Candidatus Bathyarchaeia archaeon]|jgi:hypothetical protein